jgi:hypothetical protein
MKRVILFLVLAFICPVNAASLPLTGYIGLYADGEHKYISYCPFPQGYTHAKVEMWIFCLPSERGQMGAEFAIAYPSNVMLDRIIFNNAVIAAGLGDFLSGYSTTFVACQMDWFWIAHQMLYVANHEKTSLAVIPHPSTGAYQFMNCLPGYPKEPCIKSNDLYLNNDSYPCVPPELPIGVEGSTWSAIKSLFGDSGF